jgi:CheY-like chemotaxis protein
MPGTETNSHAANAPRVARKRILLVDHRAASQHSPALLLCESGYTVDWAKSVAEARARWLPHRYHLVVISLGPGVNLYDGALLCREFKDTQPAQLVAAICEPPMSVPAAFLPDAVISEDLSSSDLLRAVRFLLA